ncbi:unnamed protein product [Triticum turgidum subsp. durum]|uniref:BSD2 cysteine rich domain-containing protein n=1 Tax=Triticum turgidum subsp. durum TaxID=4567 RepID=A0A9R1BQ84_TRITD|nr:unnamed protein product [Triticum turgidum subsp. durum]
MFQMDLRVFVAFWWSSTRDTFSVHRCHGSSFQSVVTILWQMAGAIACTQCKGGGENLEDHFGGRFKAGGLCWLCRGKREILCGSCNGAGFLGGFMSTADDTSE